MNITLELNPEEDDALKDAALANNYSEAGDMIQAIIMNHVSNLVTDKRRKTVTEIGEATDLLPYDKRIELAAINRNFIVEALSGK